MFQFLYTLFSRVSVLALGLTLLCIQCIPRALSLQLEWLGHESDHSPLSCAVVNNEENYIFASPACLHGVQREGFTFFYVCCQSRVEILTTLIMLQLPQ
jgi:hypothetical protein